MNVYLDSNLSQQIPGDLIGRWVLRSDLAPVPRTVEIAFTSKDGLPERVKVGASIWTGREGLEYEIVDAKQEKVGGVVQDRDQIGVIVVTALLKSCAGITYIRERAVVLENSTLGAIYRSCGATAAIADDFQVARFTCLRGQVPTFSITQALQEESAALILRDGRISVKRLHDLIEQEPVDTIGQTDSTDAGGSEYMERHSIPSFISTDAGGAFVMGDIDPVRAVVFLPRTAERELRNASRVLVTRRIIDSDMAQEISAGDVLDIMGQRQVVITAAHEMRAKDGVTQTSSRFWMGGLPL